MPPHAARLAAQRIVVESLPLPDLVVRDLVLDSHNRLRQISHRYPPQVLTTY